MVCSKSLRSIRYLIIISVLLLLSAFAASHAALSSSTLVAQAASRETPQYPMVKLQHALRSALQTRPVEEEYPKQFAICPQVAGKNPPPLALL